jgi:hypothetical protein
MENETIDQPRRLAEGDSQYDALEAKRAKGAAVTVGHNLPQEAPQAFAQAVVDVGHLG